MLDELVGPSDAHHRNVAADLFECFEHRRSKSAHLHVIFKGDKGGDAASVGLQHFAIDGLDEPRIDDRRGVAVALQLRSQLPGHGGHGAEAENGHVGAVGQHLGFADGQHRRFGLAGNTGHGAARIADGTRPGQLERRLHHVGQFVLVLGRHQHQAGNAAQVGNVEEPVMGGAVVAGEPGAVHAEKHRQLLQRDVVHDGIEGALQERRIDGAHGTEAARGHARREDHRVLFGDAHVEIALGMMGPEQIEAGAVGHGRGDGDNALILVGQLGQRIGE